MWLLFSEVKNLTIDDGVNAETQNLLQYFGFLSETIYEAMDLLEWVARDTYEFEKVACASGMSFSNSCAFHATSFCDEEFVTSYVPPTFIAEYVPRKYDL